MTGTNELTLGDVHEGDFIQCGKGREIYKVEYIEWWLDGPHTDKLRHFRMIDVNGKTKSYAFMKRDVLFIDGKIVDGYGKSDVCKLCGK